MRSQHIPDLPVVRVPRHGHRQSARLAVAHEDRPRATSAHAIDTLTVGARRGHNAVWPPGEVTAPQRPVRHEHARVSADSEPKRMVTRTASLLVAHARRAEKRKNR